MNLKGTEKIITNSARSSMERASNAVELVATIGMVDFDILYEMLLDFRPEG